MTLQSLFVTHIFIPPTNRSTHPSICVRSTLPALASAAPRTPHNNPLNLLTPPNLAQIARIVMSAIQLSTFLTPSLINPLYTPEILAILPSNYPVIRALGVANLSTTIALYRHRSLARPCRLANLITFSTTAIIYLASRIKPPYINLPFVSTLLFIAILNAISLPHSPKTHATVTWRLAPVAKFTAAVAACFAALSASELLSRVYLLQIALNLAVAGDVELRSPRINRILGVAESVALFSMAACLVSHVSLSTTVTVAVAALSTGWDALLGTDT